MCLFSVASRNRHGGGARAATAQQAAAMVQTAAAEEEGTAAKVAALVARLKHACGGACAVRRWEWWFAACTLKIING